METITLSFILLSGYLLSKNKNNNKIVENTQMLYNDVVEYEKKIIKID